jgi:hypothetical protein
LGDIPKRVAILWIATLLRVEGTLPVVPVEEIRVLSAGQ